MRISPVSFGSLLVFNIEDGKPKAPIPAFIKASFKNNPDLAGYRLLDTFSSSEEKVDGTIHGAPRNFAELLDRRYKSNLPNGSKDVILTATDFLVTQSKIEKRYFITAASNEEESKIHKALSKGMILFSAKFGYKM